jgi:hypothetical protein
MVDSDRSAPVANLRGGLRGAGSSKSRNDKAVIIFFSVAVAIVLIALILPESWVRPGSQEQAPPEFAPEDVGWDKLDSMHERMVETEKEQLRRRQQAVRNKAATPSPEISVPETADTDELLENYSELLEPLPGEAATENAGTGTPDSGSLMRVNPGTPGAVPGGTSSSTGLPSSTGSHTQNLPPLDAGTALPRQSSPAPGSGLPTNSTGVSTPNDPEQQRKLRELEAEIELKLQSQENSTE